MPIVDRRTDGITQRATPIENARSKDRAFGAVELGSRGTQPDRLLRLAEATCTICANPVQKLEEYPFEAFIIDDDFP